MLAFLNLSRTLIKRSFILSLIIGLLTGFVSLTAGIIDFAGTDPPENFVGSQNLLFLSSYTHSQDVTTDGENYYFSARFSLIKTEMDGRTETAMNINAIPRQLREEYGSAHIGGISCHDGKIYAAIEDSKVWKYPIAAVYDAETLAFIEYHILSAELQKNGIPWLAVDGERGLFYSARRDNSPALIVYDLNTFELVKTVPLSTAVHKIQGGEVYKGQLYAVTQEEGQPVYRIDPVTGEVEKLFEQNLAKGGEAEGLTVLPTADGALIHTLDMGPMFVNAYFRHYAWADSD